MKAWMTLKGAERLKKKLQAKAEEYEKNAELAIKAGALIVMNAAKENAPYKTGNLRRSIHLGGTGQGLEGGTTGTDIGASENRLTVDVGTNVIYAATQEFGRDGIPARPYLRPAMDENKDKVIREIERVLKGGGRE